MITSDLAEIQGEPVSPFRVIARDGRVTMPFTDTEKEVKKLIRLMRKSGRRGPKVVVFDAHWWLLKLHDGCLRRCEAAPAPDFALDCMAGAGCWSAERLDFCATWAAFCGVYTDMLLQENSRPFTWCEETLSAVTTRGILGMGEADSSRYVFFLRCLGPDHFRNTLMGPGGDWFGNQEGAFADIWIFDKSQWVRVFDEPFSSEVERRLFAARDYVRAFGTS